jgi:hypothetical protein
VTITTSNSRSLRHQQLSGEHVGLALIRRSAGVCQIDGWSVRCGVRCVASRPAPPASTSPTAMQWRLLGLGSLLTDPPRRRLVRRVVCEIHAPSAVAAFAEVR